jgi:hypothetical protein
MPAASVHFNGSVNLPDAETVMREISTRVPVGVRRMTEGETGDRGYWVFYQFQKFAAMRELDAVPVPEQAGDDYERIPQLRLAGGVRPEDVAWPEIGYAAAYAESFRTFRALQADGVVGRDVRLQMEYPTPLAAMSGFVAEDQPRLLGSYERALFADLDQALAQLPHEQIAVQWDVAVEIGHLAGSYQAAGGLDRDAVVSGLVRCIDHVPDDVAVGLHLCYGDYEHHHFVEPESLRLQVDLANELAAAARRPIGWFSFTVPQARSDDPYFAPLHDLKTGPETELSFALVPYHPAEQAQGTTAEQARLIDVHLAESPAGPRQWAISTECGMGRVDRDDVPALLDLHREILAAQG